MRRRCFPHEFILTCIPFCKLDVNLYALSWSVGIFRILCMLTNCFFMWLWVKSADSFGRDMQPCGPWRSNVRTHSLTEPFKPTMVPLGYCLVGYKTGAIRLHRDSFLLDFVWYGCYVIRYHGKRLQYNTNYPKNEVYHIPLRTFPAALNFSAFSIVTICINTAICQPNNTLRSETC